MLCRQIQNSMHAPFPFVDKCQFRFYPFNTVFRIGVDGPAKLVKAIPDMMETRQNLMNKADVQSGQQPLELSKCASPFPRLLRSFDNIVTTRLVQQDEHTPEITLFVLIIRSIG